MAVFLLASPADAHTPPYHVGYVESANRNIRVHYDTTLTLEITALPSTAAASYDLLLTNPNGLGTTQTDALQIITPPEPVDPSSGCGCNATSSSGAGGGASIILVLLIWLLIDWRSSRKPSRGRPR